MKKLFLLSMLIAPLTLFAENTFTHDSDTVVYVDKYKIKISEDGDRTKVRLYEQDNEGEFVEGKKVFEGHYRDGNSFERRFMRTISVPKKKQYSKHFEGHWDGFGMGFANIADGSFTFNDIDGVTVRAGNSLEYNLNLFGYSIPFSNTNVALVTGVGMRWIRYKLDGNVYFKEVDGVTQLIKPVDGIHLKTSKLNTTSITVPLLFEWQNRRGKRDGDLFLSGGVVGVIKTMSSSKIVYYDERNKKRKDKVDGGMNLRPITLDFLVQVGIKQVGVYAKYSPIEMFARNKGPKIHPVSIGVHLYLWDL